IGVAPEAIISIELRDERQDARAHGATLPPSVSESLGSVSAACVTIIPIVLLEKSELATAVWTGETGHAIPRSPAVSNKAFSSVPKNEILSSESDSKTAKTLLAALPIGTSRYHRSVGSAAAWYAASRHINSLWGVS